MQYRDDVSAEAIEFEEKVVEFFPETNQYRSRIAIWMLVDTLEKLELYV